MRGQLIGVSGDAKIHQSGSARGTTVRDVTHVTRQPLPSLFIPDNNGQAEERRGTEMIFGDIREHLVSFPVDAVSLVNSPLRVDNPSKLNLTVVADRTG